MIIQSSLIVILILITCLYAGCGQSSSLGSNDDDFTYPIRIGNHWKYQRSLTIYNDSLYYENPPVQSLKYPFEISSQWTYRNRYNPWHIDKKILGKETIALPAGNFECFKIQWLYDMDHDWQWDKDIVFYDYLHAKGLMKRDIKIFTKHWDDPSMWQVYEEISELTHINF
jgi:hypothetical protein